MGFFGIKGGDFFCFVEKLHRTIQKHTHIDSLMGVGAMGRFLRDLKDHPIEADRVIVGHGAFGFKAQRLLNLLGAGFSPGGLCLSGPGELLVMLWPIMIEHGLTLVRTVWIGKIYNALPKDKTTIPEYFLDAELEQFLNEAIEECYSVILAIAERTKDQFSR